MGSSIMTGALGIQGDTPTTHVGDVESRRNSPLISFIKAARHRVEVFDSNGYSRQTSGQVPT
jgi:hypothetical protein